jgi:anthranilate/para-aminobenzoate synthase component I
VRVLHARCLEAHPSVFHTVADVAGRLRAQHDGQALLAAAFPAGSVSGVPKIRALAVIDELEPVARGAYTGAVGVLGMDGNMTFNVAIRTLQMGAAAATLYVGGGIVADSEPAAEYDETLDKARGILRGLGLEPADVAGRRGEERVAS